MSISGYNCTIQYLAGSENSVADLLSRVPSDTKQDDSPLNDPDINSKTYEISALNSNRFTPKNYARCKPHFEDKVIKPTLKSRPNMVEEQDKDKMILKLKTKPETRYCIAVICQESYNS